MIHFPIVRHLSIQGYGLFPGEHKHPGLVIDFRPGITVVLGSNGLGKTTLVNVMFRLLTGPSDISGMGAGDILGTASLDAKPIPPVARRTFARRVSDGAQEASAILEFDLGGHKLRVDRRLNDLSIAHFSFDGKEQPASDESAYQARVTELAGVWSFGDWILILRLLAFYFEDRRALVWDPTAQRQILRLLLLKPDTAKRWSQDERSILELDSRARNLSAILFREERVMAVTEAKVASAPEVAAELKALEALQGIDQSEREALYSQLVELDALREATRLRALTVELDRDDRYRELERARLLAIQTRFPDQAASAKYILAQLLATSDCMVCGTHVPAFAKELESRIGDARCVVCGSDVSDRTNGALTTDITDRRVHRTAAALEAIEPEFIEARRQAEVAIRQHQTVTSALAHTDAELTARSARINLLVSRLPPDEAALHQQQTELAAMRGHLETMRQQLEQERRAFAQFLDSCRRDMADAAVGIKETFERYSRGFLFEECELRWSPQRAQLGQTGEVMEFPAFDLDLGGAGFESPVRRNGPDQVSESQREFIDLAFRMALFEVTGSGAGGTLVIDAPESSLDAVFESRAAAVLTRFANSNGPNRLMVTSNLVEGQLIPDLLRSVGSREMRKHLVNLFAIAEPTAAVRQLHKQYEAVLKRILSQAKRPRRPRRRLARAK